MTNLNRRKFGKYCASVAALAGMSQSESAWGQEKQFPNGSYFDMHTHLGQTWYSTLVLYAVVLLM